MPARPTFEVIFSPFAQRFAPVALGLSAFLPPEGLGFDLCWIHRMLAVPCPGCGLTRSFSSITHGRMEQAVVLHPFGPLLYLVFVLAIVYALLPRSVKQRIASLAVSRDAAWRVGYRMFLWSFFGFGLLRALAHQVTGTPF